MTLNVINVTFILVKCFILSGVNLEKLLNEKENVLVSMRKQVSNIVGFSYNLRLPKLLRVQYKNLPGMLPISEKWTMKRLISKS